MKDKLVERNVLFAILVIVCGLLIAGGTFAYLTVTANIINGNYNTVTTCFQIDYTDNTDQITGTLFPSANVLGGLDGSVLFKTNSLCEVNGNGTLYLRVNTNTVLTSTVAAHCENKYTLETIKNVDQATCTSDTNNKWVTNGTALKYAIYSDAAVTNLYESGYIDSTFINTDKVVHSNFSITSVQKTMYVYIWLDGNLSGSTYENISFGASMKLGATQIDVSTPSLSGDTTTNISSYYQYGI